MDRQLSDSIAQCFARNPDSGEFLRPGGSLPFTLFWPEGEPTRLVYTTKAHVVHRLLDPVATGCALLGRTGLPGRSDLPWIQALAGEKTLKFIGDLDPADLLTFVWLRESLPTLTVEYAGISDQFLSDVGVEVPEDFRIRLSPQESEAYAAFSHVWPALRTTLGNRCAELLERGEKIELEAVLSARSYPPSAEAAWANGAR